MADRRNSTNSWKTTVIVSTSLLNNETSRILLRQQHRLRFSDGVQPGAFVFPLSGTAFMMVTTQELPEKLNENVEVFERVEKFAQVHRNCFLMLLAPVYGQREWEILYSIQNRFFGSKLRVLPVHSNADVVKGMLTIAKATSKPHVDGVRDRMSHARAHIIERSPMWEMLRDIQLR